MDSVSEFLLRLKIAPIYSKTHFYGNYFNILILQNSCCENTFQSSEHQSVKDIFRGFFYDLYTYTFFQFSLLAYTR